MKLPNVHAICLSDSKARLDRLTSHMAAVGIPWTYFEGIDAKRWGLTTKRPYELDTPGSGYIMEQRQVGLHLSHYFLWRLMEYTGMEEMTIVEDDVEFSKDWESQYTSARQSVPDDWDFLMLGSGLTSEKYRRHVAGNVWEILWPMTTHAYIIRKKALKLTLETQRYSYAPIDLALYFRTWPRLNVYTVQPRIAVQNGTEIQP